MEEQQTPETSNKIRLVSIDTVGPSNLLQPLTNSHEEGAQIAAALGIIETAISDKKNETPETESI